MRSHDDGTAPETMEKRLTGLGYSTWNGHHADILVIDVFVVQAVPIIVVDILRQY